MPASPLPPRPAPGPEAPRIDRRWIWLFAAALVALVRALLHNNPAFTEVAYTRGLFTLLRWVWDYTFGWFPVPWVYMVPVLGAAWWFFFRKKKNRTGWRRLTGPVLSVVAFACAVYTVFMVSWGFNYQRMPLENLLKTAEYTSEPLDIQAIFQESTAEVVALRAQIAQDSALDLAAIAPGLETRLRAQLHYTLRAHDLPAPGRPRVKALYPKGLLMQLGASGVYIPWTGEALTDAALPGVSLPFTLAHEMSHGYGFAREDDCNFLAWLACATDTSLVLRYSAAFNHWRYVAAAYRREYPEDWKAARDSLPGPVLADLRSIRKVQEQYPGFFPDFSEKTYERYLKSQGIKEGIKSYSRMVTLVAAWKRKQAEG